VSAANRDGRAQHTESKGLNHPAEQERRRDRFPREQRVRFFMRVGVGVNRARTGAGGGGVNAAERRRGTRHWVGGSAGKVAGLPLRVVLNTSRDKARGGHAGGGRFKKETVEAKRARTRKNLREKLEELSVASSEDIMANSESAEKLEALCQLFKDRGYYIPDSELKVGKQIGKGAAGPTYIGKYKDRDVAVKVYTREVLQQDMQAVVNEMRFMLELVHENIVPFEGIVLEFSPLKIMLVSSYAKNGDLLAAIHEKRTMRRLPLEKKIEIAMGVAKGLQHVHNYGIIHRDVKCANILLSDDLKPWITDFGFSRIIDRVNTMTGETGSYRYMAPEVIRASKYTDKADIYSFGVSMNELFTGEQPFAGINAYQVAQGVAKRSVRPDYQRIPNKTLQKLVRACWQEDETRRPQWGLVIGVLQEVLQDLEEEREKLPAAFKQAVAIKQSPSKSDDLAGQSRNDESPQPSDNSNDPVVEENAEKQGLRKIFRKLRK